MIPRGKLFTVLVIILACAVFAWSCASSSGTKDETAPKESGGTAAAIVLAALAVVLVVFLLMPDEESAPAQEVDETPLREDVPPVRNTSIKVNINVTFTYTTKMDEDEARRTAINLILARLNEQGSLDGNSFSFPDGEPSNLTFDYTFYNQGQPGNDRYTGSLVMSGWGWGYIHTFDSGQYPYSDAEKLINVLTDQAYNFLHTGWHDTRKERGSGN